MYVHIYGAKQFQSNVEVQRYMKPNMHMQLPQVIDDICEVRMQGDITSRNYYVWVVIM